MYKRVVFLSSNRFYKALIETVKTTFMKNKQKLVKF